MRRLLTAVAIIMGCSRFPDHVLKDHAEALRRLNSAEEGMQADGSYVACYHITQMAVESRDFQSLKLAAQFLASSGFFEVWEMPLDMSTLRSGYEDSTSEGWACTRFKGLGYVIWNK